MSLRKHVVGYSWKGRVAVWHRKMRQQARLVKAAAHVWLLDHAMEGGPKRKFSTIRNFHCRTMAVGKSSTWNSGTQYVRAIAAAKAVAARNKMKD